MICRACNPIDVVACMDCGVKGCKHYVTPVQVFKKRQAVCFKCVAGYEEYSPLEAFRPEDDEGEFL